jgi:ferredoxin-NADP reductase
VEAPVGTAANLRLPTGTLKIHKTTNKNLVFVATGCGITPFFAMLQNLASTHADEKQVTLLWGIRDANEEFSSQYLGDVAKQLNLALIPCVPGPIADEHFYQGKVTAKIRELQLDFKNTDFYLGGNPLMIAEMHSWLRDRGAANVCFEVE